MSMTAAALSLTPVHQRYLLQARQMQTLSFAMHIPLVCFAIAFPAMVLFVEWRYLRTGDQVYEALARRWSRVLVALFAVGVITGTILSFEMGLLWPNFTATFGSVFGLGFAIEGFSFFTEAIFIAIYAYGWGRLSPRLHFLSGIPVAIAGFTGSLMVIAVNAWMNHPLGFRLRGGKVVDVHPLTALFGNRYLWHELIHMYLAGYMVAGFLLAAAYAIGRLRGRWDRYHRIAFAIPLTVAALASPVQILIGDWAGRDVATTQPIKLAAIEGLGRTTRGAPEHLLGWYSNGQVKYGIEVPHALSLLAFHSWNATVRGLNSVPPADRPPVNVVRVSFQLMVLIGTLLAVLGIAYVVLRARRKRLPESRWFYRAVIAAGPASVVALICGWIVTEVGRQPWVVYGVMRTSQAGYRSATRRWPLSTRGS
jgi:cytochrome d ubiquinol oxidase subunit I